MNKNIEFKRLIGKVGASKNGPTIICVGGIHGNEPAGIFAIECVFKILISSNIELKGQFVGLAGNLSALYQDKRFINYDLNRMWTESSVENDCHDIKTCIELQEQQDLLAELENIFDQTNNQIYFLDLHTSGAEGHPFACIGDNIRNRNFAMQFPIPIILGLEEQIDGALLEYVNNLGAITMGVEGGQHDSKNAVEFLEAIIWIALKTAKLIDDKIYDQVSGKFAELEKYSKDIPKVLEVRYRHGVDQRQNFKMTEGYSNFQKIKKNEFLATDNQKPIYAKESGRILLPLYQALGDDGFFVTREVKTFWLKISKLLRKYDFNNLLRLLPGISKHPINNLKLIINQNIAKFYTADIFHLLGYRKRRIENGQITVSRRR